MPIPKSEFIWMNGELVKWDDAKIHVLSHVVHYGSSVFEGQRVYKTDKGSVAFRLHDHSTRLIRSAKIYRMEIPYTAEEIDAAILNLVAVNGLEACYVRPIAYRGFESLGVDPSPCPVDLTIAVWPWGAYLGEEALEKGASVCFSSWNRLAPNTMPAMAKSGANYMNAQLIKLEAIANGYDEGIGLDRNGFVSEGSAQNFFLVIDKHLYTPTVASSILSGITRDCVIKLARSMGYEVTEMAMPREMVYGADEAFFSGSAAEITPVSRVDQIPIGTGKRGPITNELRKAFFDIIEGRAEDKWKWLTYVPARQEAATK